MRKLDTNKAMLRDMVLERRTHLKMFPEFVNKVCDTCLHAVRERNARP